MTENIEGKPQIYTASDWFLHTLPAETIRSVFWEGLGQQCSSR